MNIVQMHQEFLIGLDKSNTLEYPDFLPEEIDVYLNKAQEAIIKQRYSGNNVKGTGVEETQKRIEDLGSLVRNANIVCNATDPSLNKPYGRFATYPTDYYLGLQDEASIVINCGNELVTKRIPLKTITHDRYNKTIQDPFNKPGDDFVCKLTYGDDRIEIITSSNAITTANNVTWHTRYISQPVEMSIFTPQDCTLYEHMHREIVDYAVNLALENIGSERFKTQITELNRNE